MLVKEAYEGVSDTVLPSLRDIGLSALDMVTSYEKRDLIDGYVTYGDSDTGNWSRPIRSDLIANSDDEFKADWTSMVAGLTAASPDINTTNRALYTCIQMFASAYDLCKRGSRKTPGTLLEVVIGTLLSQRLKLPRLKQISLEVEREPVTVPTDIYFESKRLAIAVKMSTRDRIIQPFGHQLLLNRITQSLNLRPIASVLCAVGEVQLGSQNGKGKPCYAVCVPRQVTLYQKHVAQLSGLFYLDPPARYLELHTRGVIEVSTIGAFLSGLPPG
jgi:hypothetical protein